MLRKILIISFLKIGVCFAIVDVPYIYSKGGKNVSLFLSLSCRHCQDALSKLQDILKKKPKLNVKLCFFARNPEDRDNVIKIIALKDNITDILYIMRWAAYYPEKIKKFVEKNEKLQKLLQENIDEYTLQQARMEKEFKEKKVEHTPAWLIEETVITGVPDDIEVLIEKS